MGRIVNISDKLSFEAPVIQIGDKEYKINDTMKTVMKFNELSSTNGTEGIYTALQYSLGEDACKEIGVDDFSFKQVQVLFIAVIACMQDISFEEAEERFRRTEQSNQ